MESNEEILYLQHQINQKETEGNKKSECLDFHELFHQRVTSCKKHFEAFRPILTKYLSKVYKERYGKLNDHSRQYQKTYKSWLGKVSSTEKNAKDAEQLSHQPVTTHVSSLLSTSIPGSQLETQNGDQRWMRTVALIPNMLTTNPKNIFNSCYRLDNTKLVIGEDSAFLHPPPVQVWTEAEQRVFVQKYLVHSKAFHKISSYLPFKTTADCIRFYYANKTRLQLSALASNYKRGYPIDLDSILGEQQ